MTHHQPNPDAPYWTTKNVADYLGVSIGTVSSYRSRGQMPAPVLKVGSGTTHLWNPEDIMAWAADRPRSRRAQAEQ